MNGIRSISFAFASAVAIVLSAWPASASANPGDLDPTFGANGIATIETRATSGEAVAIQPDGKIVVVGTAAGKMTVYRFTASGSLDTSFGGGDGVLPVTGFLASADEFSDGHAVLVQPDSRIVVAGEARLRTEVASDVAVARLNPDGSLDPTFGGGGRVLIDFSTVDWGHALARQPDGKIVVAGQAREHLDDRFGVARLKTDGTLDPEFDGDGRVILDLTNGAAQQDGDWAKSVVLQPDGKIVLGGNCGDFTATTDHGDFCVARLTIDGERDTSFGGGDSFMTVDFFGRTDWGEAVDLESDGKIVVGGVAITTSGANKFGLARLTAAGALDATFGGDGRVTVDFPAGLQHQFLRDLRVDSAGRIVAVGGTSTVIGGVGFDGDVGVVRLLADGAPDSAFGVGGVVTTDVFGFLDDGLAVGLEDDGKIVVTGQARRSSAGMHDDDSLVVARYLSDAPAPTNSALFLPVVINIPPVRPQLTNGDFEAGRGVGWKEYSARGLPLVVKGFAPMAIAPHGGAWGAWLAGTPNEVSYIEQTLEIPAGRTTLAYWRLILSEDSCGGDRGGVVVDGTVVDSTDLCESTNTDGWELHRVDLRAYAGLVVRLQIRGETDASNLSHLLVDDVALVAGMAADGVLTSKSAD
jgi:uncharacterized delta-60 repeat protein